MQSPSRSHVARALVAALLTTGCYGSAPATPPRLQPALDAGATATLDVTTRRAYYDRDGYRHERHSSMQFLYGGEPKTYGEYRAVVDPKWTATLDHYDDLHRRCQRANIPKYLGIATLVGGFAFALWGANLIGEGKEDLQRTVQYTAIGAGALIFGAGYAFFGGRACNEAKRMWDGAHPWLEYAESKSMPTFDETQTELQELTNVYNARNHATAKTEPDE